MQRRSNAKIFARWDTSFPFGAKNGVSDFPETGSDPSVTVSPVCKNETNRDQARPYGTLPGAEKNRRPEEYVLLQTAVLSHDYQK